MLKVAAGLCEARRRLWREKGSTGGSKPWESVVYKKQKAASTVERLKGQSTADSASGDRMVQFLRLLELKAYRRIL